MTNKGIPDGTQLACKIDAIVNNWCKNPAAVALGKIKSPRKAETSRQNGKLGGRPKKTTP